eukprot:TRINITY_DN16226_c0_g1_i6.p1 TRINITY_DN16226_c0_g1~~TRINITY_DN16226_c0_g1_i6.p1  ORF type:complete len:674 (-),score=188.28 TRINITY_DN16226_c0_g1_i6:92-2092(-)
MDEFDLPKLDSREISKLLQDERVKMALKEGVDLKEHAKNIANQLEHNKSKILRDYQSDFPKFSTLFSSLDECESILDTMEQMLKNFEEQLSTSTNQIIKMQGESKEYTLKLENRKKMEKNLNQFLNDMYFPKNMIEVIRSGRINKQYVQYLIYFDQKLDFMESQEREVVCVKEQIEAIASLKEIASASVFKWLSRKILLPKKDPKTLASLKAKHQSLKKYGLLFKFLKKRDTTKAKAIIDEYIKLSSGLTLPYTQKSIALVDGLKTGSVSKSHLLGQSQTASGLSSIFGPKSPNTENVNVFSLKSRPNALSFDQPIQIPQGQKQKLNYEYLFRSLLDLFYDMAEDEYLFTKDFFYYDLSDRVLQKSIDLITDNLQRYISSSHDCIGILIILGCILHFKNELNSKGCHNLDNFMSQLTKSLESRFNLLITMHVDSFKALNSSSWGPLDCRTPHYVTRRYSQFLSSLLSESLKVVNLDGPLQSLRTGIMSLLERMGNSLNGEERMIFLINNYALIQSIFSEQDVGSDVSMDFQKNIKNELDMEADKYCESQLEKYFPQLVDFYNTYIIVDNAGHMSFNVPQSKDIVQKVLQSFSSTLQKQLQLINDNMLMNFPTFILGKHIYIRLTQKLDDKYSSIGVIIAKNFSFFMQEPYYVPSSKVSQFIPTDEE